MAITTFVKEELLKTAPAADENMLIETAAMVRLSMQTSEGPANSLVLTCDFGSRAVATRLNKNIKALFGEKFDLKITDRPLVKKKGRHYFVLNSNVSDILLGLGLVNHRRQLVTGFPSLHVSKGYEFAKDALIGAILARGSVIEPSRYATIEISTPNINTALGLVGFARKLGIDAKHREAHGGSRMVIKDAEHCRNILEAIGAEESAKLFTSEIILRTNKAEANRLSNFDVANLKRAAEAAAENTRRVRRAFEILGNDPITPMLREAGELRIAHPSDSLEECAKYAKFDITRDALAGRLRRLLAAAEVKAKAQGIPGPKDLG